MKVKVLDKGYVELIDSMGDDKAIVTAARASYKQDVHSSSKWTAPDAGLLKQLYMSVPRHTTPFEMVEFKFKVKAPLFVMRQWQRHRTWSYNELSRRYTGEGIEFYEPEGFYEFEYYNKRSKNVYEMMLHDPNLSDKFDKKRIKEVARLVFPKTIYSTMYAKVDLHNLLHFLRLRNHPHAQWEIQEYARAIEKLIEPIVPETMKLYREEKDGNHSSN